MKITACRVPDTSEQEPTVGSAQELLEQTRDALTDLPRDELTSMPHAFDPDIAGVYCRLCHLPRRNRRHVGEEQ